MKKIRGKIHYFGTWAKRVNGKRVRFEGDAWEQALALYKVQADDLHAGRTPRANTDGLSIAVLCNRFLTAKQRTMEAEKFLLSQKNNAMLLCQTENLSGLSG